MPTTDNSLAYERKLQKLIADFVKKIQEIYHDAIVKVSLQSILVRNQGKEFNIDFSPYLKKQIDNILAKMQRDIQSTVINSVKEAWDLSNKKNNSLVNDYIGQKKINAALRSQLYQPNLGALNAFIERTEKGMNLSKRVWNLVEPFQFELEAGLKDGIGKGESAAQIANKLKRFLNEPDKLFRRVRDEKTGNLQLSRAARMYNPGAGIYRSSYKNALRLTASETNISYKTADHARWQKLDFVIGIKINLSASHVFKKDATGKLCGCEICEQLSGLIYPKGFLFQLWHPSCRCFAQSILMTKEDYNKLLNFKYGRSDKPPKIKYIDTLPKAFTLFVKTNQQRIKSWSNTPYWYKNNPEFIKQILK